MSAEQAEEKKGRQELEAAVTKVGKAFDALVRVIEKYGQEIQRADLDKAFFFLEQVRSSSHNKAALSLATAIAANGGFSLDAFESQSTVIMQPGLPVDGSITSITPVEGKGSRFHEVQQHGGRLIGGKPKANPLDDPDASDFFEE